MNGPLPDVGTELVEAARRLHNVASRFHDEQPCRFDHSGFCQEHACEPPCRNAMLRLALAHFPIEFFAFSPDQVDDELAALGNPPSKTEALIDRLGILGEEILAELRHIRSQAGERISSATVKTSTRGTDLEVHSYDDGRLGAAVDDAISEYARGRRVLDMLQATNWAATVDGLRERVAEAAGK